MSVVPCRTYRGCPSRIICTASYVKSLDIKIIGRIWRMLKECKQTHRTTWSTATTFFSLAETPQIRKTSSGTEHRAKDRTHTKRCVLSYPSPYQQHTSQPQSWSRTNNKATPPHHRTIANCPESASQKILLRNPLRLHRPLAQNVPWRRGSKKTWVTTRRSMIRNCRRVL